MKRVSSLRASVAPAAVLGRAIRESRAPQLLEEYRQHCDIIGMLRFFFQDTLDDKPRWMLCLRRDGVARGS
jgi:hypothetical protein